MLAESTWAGSFNEIVWPPLQMRYRIPKDNSTMTVNISRRDHIQAVREWLQKNVRMYPTPSKITLRQIRLDRKELRGKALLLIDDALPGEELALWMSESGRLTFSPPLFHSPLGAPATYIAIELTANTKQAVTAAVQGLLPKLLPLGINPKTKEWVTTSTPLHDRIVDMADFETAFERITHPDFKSVQVVSPE
jgi:hypothetical protein